jgi:hypothetical protein
MVNVLLVPQNAACWDDDLEADQVSEKRHYQLSLNI